MKLVLVHVLVFACVASTIVWAEGVAVGGGQLSYPTVLLEPNRGRSYELPALPFAYGALEPHIDEATVRVHHGGHQRTYTNNMNELLAQWRAQVRSRLPLLPVQSYFIREPIAKPQHSASSSQL